MELARTSLNAAPGSVVVVRDEEWLVTGVDPTTDGHLLAVQGLSELVRDTTATFYEHLDTITVIDPADAQVVADSSPGYRRSRLWLEATLRKTALPVDDPSLAVSTSILADPLDYQHQAVRRALDPENLRPRILLADAVGLGKTLEIGMILSELVRRGRGDRILIVTPKHVLEQMQHEMWTRFALPFVRLDSVGIQRVRQKLPATRNPFTMYKRAIISIDTLKNERYLSHLRKHRWDAVVIDESHNVTNTATQNNRLAQALAPHTDALILASATPHNGKSESFAELVRLLEPTAVNPDGGLVTDEVRRLVVRRHRNSPEVASVVGADWAERHEPDNRLIAASDVENAVADELAEVWLHPQGNPPSRSSLFPWTLAKAFLSSPVALEETCRQRLQRISGVADMDIERAALQRLTNLAQDAAAGTSSKYDELLGYLRKIGVGRRSPTRAVIFAERVATLRWLQEKITHDLGLGDGQVRIMHGGLTDQEQQEIVSSFKQEGSAIRVLVTGDVASEGVNLHQQCHELIHFDIPWSLIRIEQRNGRIDRYGQRHSPQITTLLLEPSNPKFTGDIRVLSRLLEREHEAHVALGDVASLMGDYDGDAEEKSIQAVLAGAKKFDDVVRTVQEIQSQDDLAGLLARLMAPAADEPPAPTDTDGRALSLYDTDVDFLREALQEAFIEPGQDPHPTEPGAGGVRWREHPRQHIVELIPPRDLQRRLEVLPQSYLTARKITETLKLATSKQKGIDLLQEALAGDVSGSWPEAHYLGPLHPILDWASDRALVSLGRNQVFAIRGDVDAPHVLLLATLLNRRGLTVTSAWMAVEFPTGSPQPGFVHQFASAAEMFESSGVSSRMSNPGGVAAPDALRPLIPAAVRNATAAMAPSFEAAAERANELVKAWSDRVRDWTHESDALIQRSQIKQHRASVEEEQRLSSERVPDRTLVRPLLVVVPQSHPVEGEHP